MNYLPPLFICNDFLCGMVLKRVTSKLIFKKWNRCVFVVKPSFLQLYRTVTDWKQQGPVYWQTNIHSFMVLLRISINHSIVDPSLKKHMTIQQYTHSDCQKTQEQMYTSMQPSKEFLSAIRFLVIIRIQLLYSEGSWNIWLSLLWNCKRTSRQTG